MKLLYQLKEMLTQARKDKAGTVPFLSTLYAEVQKVGKNNGNRETTDEEAVKVLKKLKQGNDELIKLSGDREDVRRKAEEENSIIEQFLPKQMSEPELRDAIKNIILSEKLDSPKGLGIVMKQLTGKFSGQYDGKLASSVAKEMLSA